MKPLLISIIFNLIVATTIQAQAADATYISKADSVLLQQFWNGFRKTINERDTVGLSKYFHFPFYCSPCLDYVSIKDPDNPPPTIRVSKQIFNKSVYKLFLYLPNRNKLTKQWWLENFIFSPSFNDQNKRNGFECSFILFPSSNRSPGSQAFVYLKKYNGKYLIQAVDHIP